MIVVAGPEGSGTNMLKELIATLGLDVAQRSIPHAGVWWAGDDILDPETAMPFPEGTRFVVILRDQHCTIRSVLRRRLAANITMAYLAHQEARHRCARLPAVRVSYEAIVADPFDTLCWLADALGVARPTSLPFPITDENAKWAPA